MVDAEAISELLWELIPDEAKHDKPGFCRAWSRVVSREVAKVGVSGPLATWGFVAIGALIIWYPQLVKMRDSRRQRQRENLASQGVDPERGRPERPDTDL